MEAKGHSKQKEVFIKQNPVTLSMKLHEIAGIYLRLAPTVHFKIADRIFAFQNVYQACDQNNLFNISSEFHIKTAFNTYSLKTPWERIIIHFYSTRRYKQYPLRHHANATTLAV